MDTAFLYFGKSYYKEPFCKLNCLDNDIDKIKTSFSKLIQDNKIESNEKELFEILCRFSHEWSLINYKMNFAYEDKDLLRDGNLLINFLKEYDPYDLKGISRIEFGDQACNGFITSDSVIHLLLDNLNIIRLREDIEYMIENQNCDRYRQKSKNKIKLSFIEEYLLSFFNWLKNETMLGQGSDNEIYRFIAVPLKFKYVL
ncbi:MAG: hypothetical protein RBS73_16850 [Prolixibacteraceae bacterium]|jgi:hypothetical protein|nr:hypothetical protein [Prolixibacteraceae bacterium]